MGEGAWKAPLFYIYSCLYRQLDRDRRGHQGVGNIRSRGRDECVRMREAEVERVVSNWVLWSREHESREVFLSSSLCVGDRTPHCSFHLWRFVSWASCSVNVPVFRHRYIVDSYLALALRRFFLYIFFNLLLSFPYFLVVYSLCRSVISIIFP